MHPGKNPFESGMEMKGKALICLLLVLSFFTFSGVSAARTIEDYSMFIRTGPILVNRLWGKKFK